MIKFIAALIGYYLLRFPGAILGYLIGSFIENMNVNVSREEPSFRPNNSQQGNFSHSFLVLTTAILKANSNITKTEFTVAIIPYTYTHTTFNTIEPGTVVNIEFDIIGKYVNRISQVSTMGGKMD